MMKAGLILYTNETTRNAKWEYGNRALQSTDHRTFETMAMSHNLLNIYIQDKDLDRAITLSEAIKLMLKTHGCKISSN